MVPVPSYQVIEFLEWMSRREILIHGREHDWTAMQELAAEFLQREGVSLFDGFPRRPSLEFLLRVFQECPMIREPSIFEQMHHFAGCGSCPNHMREEGRRTFSTLRPLLRGFLECAARSGFDQWVERECSSAIGETAQDFRHRDGDHLFSRIMKVIGPNLEREFAKYLQEGASPSAIRDYEDFRRQEGELPRSRRTPFKRMQGPREEGTEPINGREDPREAAHRLVASVQQLVSGGFYDQYLAANHELCRWLSLTTQLPEDLAQSLEFLAWLSKEHPGLDIAGNVPSEKIREFVFMFCEAVGYSNGPSFAATVEKWMRGEGSSRALSRIWDFVRHSRRSRGGRSSGDHSPFQRYKTVKLHAMFLFLSSGDFPSFIEEHWADLNALTGDHVDIYYSKEDLKRRVSGYETLAEFKTLKVTVTDLPALILWTDDLADARAVPLGTLPQTDIVDIMKTVVASVIQGMALSEIAEAAADEARNRIRRLTATGVEYVETKIIVNGGDNIMRDKFQVSGQAGAVGPNAHAHDMTFNQLWNAAAADIDLGKLANELTTLREGMRKHEKSAEHALATGEIAGAEIAAARGDGPTVMQHLKNAGKWALSCAEKIGVGLAVVALKKAIGI